MPCKFNYDGICTAEGGLSVCHIYMYGLKNVTCNLMEAKK